MSNAAGYIQAPTDSTGKRIGNFAVTLPAGTFVTNADGTTTQLTSDTTVFLQRVVVSDPNDASAGGAVLNHEPLSSDYAPAVRDLNTADLLGSFGQFLAEWRELRDFWKSKL